MRFGFEHQCFIGKSGDGGGLIWFRAVFLKSIRKRISRCHREIGIWWWFSLASIIKISSGNRNMKVVSCLASRGLWGFCGLILSARVITCHNIYVLIIITIFRDWCCWIYRRPLQHCLLAFLQKLGMFRVFWVVKVKGCNACLFVSHVFFSNIWAVLVFVFAADCFGWLAFS